MKRYGAFVAVLVATCAAVSTGNAQVAVTSIIAGRDLERDTSAITIRFVFNPALPSLKPRNVALASWRAGSATVYLNPLASIDFGSGSATADNANIGLVLSPWVTAGPRAAIAADFGGKITVDKTFATRLWLGTASVVYRLGTARDDWFLGVALEVGLDAGVRSEPFGTESYLRYWPGIALDVAWRERLAYTMSAKWQTIADHDAVVPDGTYVRGGSKLTFTLIRRDSELGLQLRHEYGREPPHFRPMNTVGAGLVFSK